MYAQSKFNVNSIWYCARFVCDYTVKYPVSLMKPIVLITKDKLNVKCKCKEK